MKRETAVRMFSFEFKDMNFRLKSNSKTAYYLSPTGALVNRIFVVGVLLEKYETSPDSNFWKIKIADPTGTFYGYIGRYQPEALEKIHDISDLSIVAITGKIKILETENGKFTTLRPENISIVDETVRDIWTCETAKRTLERIAIMREKPTKLSKIASEVYKTNLNDYLANVKKAITTLEESEDIEEEDIEEIEELIYEFETDEWSIEELMN
jgi:RPA family protein